MRLFIAIDISEELRKSLEEFRARLLPLTSLRLVDPENVHLTLKFLGEVADNKAEELKVALASAPFSSLRLETTRLGLFSHALWLGLKHNKELLHLQRKIEQAVKPFLFVKEERAVSSYQKIRRRKYKPHLTVARFSKVAPREREKLQEMVRTMSLRKEWEARSFALYQSVLLVDGPHYKVVERYPKKKDL